MNTLEIANYTEPLVKVAQVALAERKDLLDVLETIGDITSAEDYERAALAIAPTKTFLKDTETSRTEVKKPFLQACRLIDSKAKDFKKEVESKVANIQRDMSAWDAAEKHRQREAEEKQRRESGAIKRQEEEVLRREKEAQAKAEDLQLQKDMAELDNEKFDDTELLKAQGDVAGAGADFDTLLRERVRIEQTPVKVERPRGTVVQDVWKFEVTDALVLANARPDLVSIEPSKSAIQSTLKRSNGAEIPGLRSWTETKTIVKSG